MKTLKKALSIILGLAMVLSCVAGMQVSVAAEGTVALKVGTATVADGVVTVPVEVTENAGFQALAVTVGYDDTVLTLANVAKNTTTFTAADSAVVGPTANPVKIMWAFALNEANETATGTIATLTFNVVEGADVDTTAIDLEVTEAWDVAGNEVTATATDGVVTFGPKVDSALVVAGASVGFGTSSLEVNFRIRKTVIALYDNVELVIVPQKYDAITLDLVAVPTEIVADLTLNGNFYTYNYADIYLYELGLNIDYMLKAYDADGNLVAVSQNYTTSPASYLRTTYAASTDAKLRTLIADTLVVGANSVSNMAVSYPDSDLAAATSIIDGFDTSEATSSVASYNTIDEFNSYNSNFTTASAATHRVMKSVTIGKVPFIGFRVKDSSSALDLTKLSYRVAYTQVDGAGDETAYDKTFDSSNTAITKAGSWVTFDFSEVGLQDGDKDLFIEIIYDGEIVCDMTYSIETYLGSMMTNETIGDLATAIIKLGNSFRAYSAS